MMTIRNCNIRNNNKSKDSPSINIIYIIVICTYDYNFITTILLRFALILTNAIKTGLMIVIITIIPVVVAKKLRYCINVPFSIFALIIALSSVHINFMYDWAIGMGKFAFRSYLNSANNHAKFACRFMFLWCKQFMHVIWNNQGVG